MTQGPAHPALKEPTPEQLAAADAERRQWQRGMTRDFAGDIVVSGVLPWLAVYILERYGVGVVAALTAATVFPLAHGTFSLVRRHRLDAIGTINLTFLVASIGVTFVTGDVHVILLRGALLTFAFSLLCLGSLAAPRPLMFYIGRQMSTRDDPVREAAWNARWQYPGFRRVMRLITLVWGLGYLFEVIVRVLIAYRFAPLVSLALAPVVTYGVLVLLIVWTIAYGGAMRRKYAAYG